MRINFFMTLIALSFFTVAGLTVAEYYVSHEAVAAGLQQCKIDNNIMWVKECK